MFPGAIIKFKRVAGCWEQPSNFMAFWLVAYLSLAGKRFDPYSRVALTSVTSFELRSANRIREVGNGKNHTA